MMVILVLYAIDGDNSYMTSIALLIATCPG